MPALKNIKHEQFAQNFCICGNASEAWRQATGKTKDANVHADEFMAVHGMKDRINEIRAAMAEKTERKKEDLVKFIWDVVDGAIEADPQQLRAAELLGRMHGWNEPDKVETDGTMEIIIRKE